MGWLVVLASGLCGLSRADAVVEVASLSTVLADIARNVGGERVHVVDVVRPGIDPHLFEPSPGEVRQIAKAQIVLANGLGFEGYLDSLREGVGAGPKFVVAGESVRVRVAPHEPHDHDEPHHHGEEGVDPHWWHSVGNAKLAARAVRDALIEVDPAGRSDYEANTMAYLQSLDRLERWIQSEVAQIPRSRRILVTSHDALGYFAQDTGFVILPVQGISTTEQPSSQKVRHLIAEIQKQGVKAIFAEDIENAKVLEEITRETGASLGGTLYTDGLGQGDAATYEGMMRHNVETIVGGLR